MSDTNQVILYGNNRFGQCGSGQKRNHVSTVLTGKKHFEGEMLCDVVCGLDHTVFLTMKNAAKDFRPFPLSKSSVKSRLSEKVTFNAWSCGWSPDGQTGQGSY